jgi:hypothetical protein
MVCVSFDARTLTEGARALTALVVDLVLQCALMRIASTPMIFSHYPRILSHGSSSW